MRSLSVAAGEGRLRVTLDLRAFGDGRGIAATLYGGERPHVGGQALAAPGPRLGGRQLSRVDVWSATVPGHKDAEVAAAVARELCLACNQPVSVVAGIHVDDATEGEIRALSDACLEAARRAARLLGDDRNERGQPGA